MTSSPNPAFALSRREAVEALLADRKDTLVVTGLGSASYDVHAAGDRADNYHLWGAMGAAAFPNVWTGRSALRDAFRLSQGVDASRDQLARIGSGDTRVRQADCGVWAPNPCPGGRHSADSEEP